MLSPNVGRRKMFDWDRRSSIVLSLQLVLVAITIFHTVPYCSATSNDVEGYAGYGPHTKFAFVPLRRDRRQLPETNSIGVDTQNRTQAIANASAVATTTTTGGTTTTSTAASSAAPAAATAATNASAAAATVAPPPPAPAASTPATTTTPTTAAPAVSNDTSYDDLDELSAGDHPYHINGTNVTQVRIDDHKYYVSQFVPDGSHFWVDLEKRPAGSVVKHEMLSEAHRRAARVPLSFEFPFYGHLIRNITIATGGFLYTGDYLHSWLAATQYIAPLMANFDTTATDDSVIKYSSNDTSLTVQWEKVPLQEANNTAFSFQVTIHKTGDVVFAYRDIPVDIAGIKTSAHPVKVGMSDAYIIDRTVFFVKRKTIYEYHRIDLKYFSISNKTAVVFRAQPTCVFLHSCASCLNHPDIKFNCAWCEDAKRCSDGLDRYRQEWLESRCHNSDVRNVSQCAAPRSSVAPATAGGDAEVVTSTVLPDMAAKDAPQAAAAAAASADSDSTGGGLSSSAAATVVVLIVLVVALGGWLLYAYLFPHSTSGQILIRYRPSQWRMRRGEARYTAASIHM